MIPLIKNSHTLQPGAQIPQPGPLPTGPCNKSMYSKTCVKRPLSERQKMVFKTNYRLMQVKSIAKCSKASILPLEHSAILLTFTKLSFVIKIFVLSIFDFEWQFYTGFIATDKSIPNYDSIKNCSMINNHCLTLNKSQNSPIKFN